MKAVVVRRIYQDDRGIWRLEFERDGRLFHFSLRTRIEAVAEAKAEQYRRDLAEHNARKRSGAITMSYSYDDKCEDLAAHFLDGEKGVTETDVKELSQAIQDAVEDWFFMREHKDAL